MDKYGMILKGLTELISRAPSAPLVFAESDCRGAIQTRCVPLIELLFVVRGEVRLSVGGSHPRRMMPGDCALINAHHGNRGEPGREAWCYDCVSFNIAGMRSLRPAVRTPLFEIRAMDNLEGIHQLYREVVHLAHSPSPYLHEIQVKAAVLRLLTVLYGSGKGIAAMSPAVGDRRLQAAMSALRERQGDPALCVTDLARAAGLSPDHLGRLFRREFGMSPMPYLLQLRLNRARLLLKHSGVSVKEVAFVTGFSDPLYFSRAFRKAFDAPPSLCRA